MHVWICVHELLYDNILSFVTNWILSCNIRVHLNFILSFRKNLRLPIKQKIRKHQWKLLREFIHITGLLMWCHHVLLCFYSKHTFHQPTLVSLLLFQTQSIEQSRLVYEMNFVDWQLDILHHKILIKIIRRKFLSL